jgi:DNA-binding NtrC family response regulator
LEDLEREGAFRQDLYYRLAVITLNLPPLRERAEDIPGLLDEYLRHFSALVGRPSPVVPDAVHDAMRRYTWPGNIRELINVVERAVLLATGPIIDLVDLPTNIWAEPSQGILTNQDQASPSDGPATQSYVEARNAALASFEIRYLSSILESTHGRVGEAARRTGLSPRSLYSKMKAYGLRKEDFRT